MSLYAPRDDAPRRMRKESHTAYLISIVVMGLVTALGWAVFKFFTPQWMKSSTHNEFAPTAARPLAPKLPELNASDHRPSSVTPPIEGSIRPPAVHELDAQGRQVVFNAQNYRPNANINIIQSPQVQYAASRSQQIARSSKTSPIQKSASWKWVSANGSRTSGHFVWLEANGQIDYSSVCQNYSQGSLIYRDCRKGAKVKFKELCRAGHETTCHAENNFMP